MICEIDDDMREIVDDDAERLMLIPQRLMMMICERLMLIPQRLMMMICERLMMICDDIREIDADTPEIDDDDRRD